MWLLRLWEEVNRLWEELHMIGNSMREYIQHHLFLYLFVGVCVGLLVWFVAPYVTKGGSKSQDSESRFAWGILSSIVVLFGTYYLEIIIQLLEIVFFCVVLGGLGSLVGIIVAIFKGGEYVKCIVNGFMIGAYLGFKIFVGLSILAASVMFILVNVLVIYSLFF